MSETNTVSPLRQRMIEDMAARKLNPHTQRSHIYSCKRFAAWLKRSPDTAMPDEVRRFQLHLIESGSSICNRNRIMTGVRFLFRVTLRRHDLAAEVWHLKEPQKLPPVLSPEEVKRVLTMATSLKARAMLTLAYGCGLRAGEVVRLRAGDIDSEQMIIRVVAAFSPERLSSLEDLANWPRLRMTLLETLRLYPPVPHLVREPVVDDQIVGEPVKARSQVWISPWVTHRHRKFWEEPTAFIPERFAGKASPWTMALICHSEQVPVSVSEPHSPWPKRTS